MPTRIQKICGSLTFGALICSTIMGPTMLGLGLLGNRTLLKTSLGLIFIQNTLVRRIDFINRISKTYLNASYYLKNLKEIQEEQFEKEKCMIPYTPHGFMSFGITLNINSDLFLNNGNRFILVGSRAAMYTPVLGLFVRAFGVQSADGKNFESILQNNKNVIFVPGGYEEASLTSRKDYCLYVRKGFIKYGLKYGYNLYPSFIFNENKLYNYLEGFGKLKLLLNKLKIPGIIPYSKFGIFPYRDVEVQMVIGKKIKLPKIENPTDEDIDIWHNQYYNAIVQLFHKYKVQFDPEANLRFYDKKKGKISQPLGPYDIKGIPKPKL